jgi:ATP-dependent Clp protease adaptor protein ClpS
MEPGIEHMNEPMEPENTADETTVTVVEAPTPTEKHDASSNTKTRRQPPYNVVILNDEEHTFDYVIELLMKLFRHPQPTAENLTWRIHNTGRAVVYTTHREKAELKQAQVLAYGPDPRMEISKGPLGCYIEPAEG